MSTGPLAFVDLALDELRLQGVFRPLRVIDGEQAARASVDGRTVVNLSSNNYLGLTTHPVLRERALEAVRRFGVGTGSVRPIAGTMALHMELERRLAAFKRTEAAVVFQSGFTANAGTVASLLELHVQRHRAGDRPHGSRADSEPADCLERALAQHRMRGQTEIVVGGQVDHCPAVHRRARGLLAVDDAQRTEHALPPKLVQRQIDERQGPGGHGKRAV